MENILEKVTLYDILGYLFPGSVFLIMLVFGMEGDTKDFMERWKEQTALLNLAFILISYLAGVLLSEISEQIQSLCARARLRLRKVWEEKNWKILKNKKLSETRLGDRKFVRKLLEGDKATEDMVAAFQDQIAMALIHSGNTETKNEIKKKLGKEDRRYYNQYIYGIIQGSQDYTRIHSYASSYVMYKNIAAAVLVGSGILFLNSSINAGLLAVGILAGVLLIKRSYRFMRKKNQYAWIWFMEKYREG